MSRVGPSFPSFQNSRYLTNQPSNQPTKKTKKQNQLDSISTIAGNGNKGNQDGNVLVASFDSPYTIAVDWNNSPEIVYVADTGNSCIRKINQTSSIVSTFSGACSSSGYLNGSLLSALYFLPKSIRYLSSFPGSRLLVADSGNNVIRMIDITSGWFQNFFFLKKPSFRPNPKPTKNASRHGFDPGGNRITWIS